MEHETYDVAIVGGGAAGLSAALVLGRARRRVVVVDAGAPRNAPAAHMQGFLSRDGMPPADLLASRAGRGPRATASRSSKTAWSTRSGFALRLGERPDRRGATACSSRPVPSTSCPTSPALGSAGAATSSTARIATAGRCATSRSACSGPVLAPSTTRSSSASGREDVIFFAHTLGVTEEERAALAARGHRRRRRGRRAARRSSMTACKRFELADGRSVPRAAVFIRPVLRPARGRPRRSAGLRAAARTDSSGSTPTGGRACPASGRPATPPTHERR